MKRIYVILIFALLALSCRNGADIYPEFVLDDTVRLEVEGNRILEYDSSSCQRANNMNNTEFRVLKDDASDYFIVRLNYLPSREGDCTTALVEWTAPDRFNTKTLSLRCVKVEGNHIWLWGVGSIGIVLEL